MTYEQTKEDYDSAQRRLVVDPAIRALWETRRYLRAFREPAYAGARLAVLAQLRILFEVRRGVYWS